MTKFDDRHRFEIAAHAASLGVWDWDLTTGKFYYSERAKEICGFDPSKDVTYEQIVSVTHPDDLPWTSALGARSIDPQVRARDPYRYRIVRADTGAVRWVLAHGEAVFDETTSPATALRYVGTLQDITQQHEAEQALIESESRLRYAIEAGNMAVWEIDLDRNTITPSPQLNRLCGFPVDATPTLEDLRGRYAPGEEERIERERSELVARGETQIQTTFKQLWPDGSEHWLLLRASAAPPSETIARRAVGVLVDITAQKLAEQNAAMIAREMQHRVKNALTVVQTLAAHSFRGNTDVEEVRRSFMGRLGALAAATQSVTSDGWSDSDLHQLIEQIVKPYRGAERDPFLLQGPAVHLPRKGATAVALGLHELCTNAIKYGALSVPDGRVKIDWSMRDEMLLLTWTELDGPVVGYPPAKGFGTALLQRGLLEPGAVDLVFESTGVVCHLRVPTTP